MTGRRFRWLAGAACLGLVALTVVLAVVVLSPVRGKITEADCERIRMGMTLAEVEAVLGPAIPDEQSIVGPGWKSWGDRTSEVHVSFGENGGVTGWVLHPLRPLLLHHILLR